MNVRLVFLWSVVGLLGACSGGGGGGGGNAAALRPFAINDAASPALAADVRDLLEAGDRFQYEPDVAAANAIYDAIWAQLVAFTTWVAPNPLNTYQFFVDTDPNTNWGRAYRFTGFSVFAGPVVPFTAGTYTRASGASFPAVTLRTWDDTNAELLIMLDAQNFVHAIQHVNGLPIVDTFRGS